jgi:putative DNA primase/helicase
LDELAQLDPREAAEIAYLLANGSGKSRMSRTFAPSKRLTWRLLFVSSGEITLSDHARTAGQRVRAGAEVRLLNIDADAGAGMGAFENLHGASSAADFANRLKQAAIRYYGTPLRALLDLIIRERQEVERALPNFRADFLTRFVPKGASGEVVRAAQRFAVIAAAGELASVAGITGWDADEATAAAARCFQSWMVRRGTTQAGDTEAALRQVRQFLEAHGSSRFQPLESGHQVQDREEENDVLPDRAGFRRVSSTTKQVDYLLLPEVFRTEVCAGYDYRLVRQALDQREFLTRDAPHWTMKPRQLPGMPGGARVYCIRGAILEQAE